MKKLIVLAFVAATHFCLGQKAENLFKTSDDNIYWLGIDFSKVQLVGDFSQFAEAGQKSTVEIKTQYFPGWNRLIVDERSKYDIKGMLRKENVIYNIDMIGEINATASTEEMETDNPKKFTEADIATMVKQYNPEKKDGIGIVFVAETLNKGELIAWFHFVAIDLSSNTVLFSDRLSGKPMGFGLRNYWAGAIYDIIKDIKSKKYKEWKSKYGGA
jgi:hypothetical protein